MIKLVLGVLITCAVLAFTATRLVSSSQENKKTTEEATPVEVGKKTSRQREHGKLFKHEGPKLNNIPASAGGDVEVVQDEGYVIELPGTEPNRPILQSAVCNADAVVVGIIKSKTSQVNEQNNFVFTDHEFAVEEVIKNNSANTIEPNSIITVTRDGGSVNLNGRIFRARREDFKPTLVGERYLFLLRFVPSTGSYIAYGSGSFHLSANRVKALGGNAQKTILNNGEKDQSKFLSEARFFAGSVCEHK
jgi:hypothetical protein